MSQKPPFVLYHALTCSQCPSHAGADKLLHFVSFGALQLQVTAGGQWIEFENRPVFLKAARHPIVWARVHMIFSRRMRHCNILTHGRNWVSTAWPVSGHQRKSPCWYLMKLPYPSQRGRACSQGEKATTYWDRQRLTKLDSSLEQHVQIMYAETRLLSLRRRQTFSRNIRHEHFLNVESWHLLRQTSHFSSKAFVLVAH